MLYDAELKWSHRSLSWQKEDLIYRLICQNIDLSSLWDSWATLQLSTVCLQRSKHVLCEILRGDRRVVCRYRRDSAHLLELWKEEDALVQAAFNESGVQPGLNYIKATVRENSWKRQQPLVGLFIWAEKLLKLQYVASWCGLCKRIYFFKSEKNIFLEGAIVANPHILVQFVGNPVKLSSLRSFVLLRRPFHWHLEHKDPKYSEIQVEASARLKTDDLLGF